MLKNRLWDELVQNWEDPVRFHFVISWYLSTIIRKLDDMSKNTRIVEEQIIENSWTLKKIDRKNYEIRWKIFVTKKNQKTLMHGLKSRWEVFCYQTMKEWLNQLKNTLWEVYWDCTRTTDDFFKNLPTVESLAWLTEKGTTFKWNLHLQIAFERLKEALTTGPAVSCWKSFWKNRYNIARAFPEKRPTE